MFVDFLMVRCVILKGFFFIDFFIRVRGCEEKEVVGIFLYIVGENINFVMWFLYMWL